MSVHSAGTVEGALAVMLAAQQAARDDDGYTLTLNASDIGMFVQTLHLASRQVSDVEVAAWAADMLSSIGATVDVELI